MLTASIVIFNTKQELIESVVNSVLQSACVQKLFIIDNAPKEQNAKITEFSPIIEYIPHKNTGYGDSHNIALKKSVELGADYHVILNPDIRFEKNVLQTLVDYMQENQDAVYILPKVIYPNGELQYLCKLLPTPQDLIFRRFIPSVLFFKKWKQKKMQNIV